MLSVRAISNQILSHEGGFSDDPDDPGGPTNFGITLAALRNAGRDLDGDGDIDRDDILRLTRAIAIEIFEEDYYRAPRIYLLPEALQPVVYDMQVNAGAQAIILLQRLLRDMGFDVAVDGVIGPITARAAQAASSRKDQHADGGHLAKAAVAQIPRFRNGAPIKARASPWPLGQTGAGAGAWP